MKKFLSLILVLSFLIIPIPVKADTEFYVKYRASDIRACWTTIAESISPGAMYSEAPFPWVEDDYITVNGDRYLVHCVKPTWDVEPVATIASNDANNADINKLTAYIESHLVYTQTDQQYTDALGTASTVPSINELDAQYNPKGQTYVITGVMGGGNFSTTLNVTPTTMSKPTVSVAEDGTVTCVPENIEYSTDKVDWRDVGSGRMVDSRVKGNTLYFRTPATTYSSASEIVTYTPGGQSAPSVSINDDGSLYCSPSEIEYSTDGKTWITIVTGTKIPSNLYGTYIKFRTPATVSKQASSTIEVYCKKTQSASIKTPVLKSNSYSVWIENTSDYTNIYEFALDDGSFGRKTEWTNLSPETEYKVSVRLSSTSDMFPSSAVSSTVKTTSAGTNEVTYEKVSNSSTIYIQAKGTSKVTYSGNQLVASYSDSDLRALKAEVTSANSRTDVVTTLDINMSKDDTDTRTIKGYKFTMPSGFGLLQLRLHTPMFTVVRTVETTQLSITTNVSGSKATEWAKGKSHVFRVDATGKTGTIGIIFPWEWADRADLSGLEVGYCDTNGDNAKKLTYQVSTDGVRFNMPGNGYFYIQNLNRDYGKLPFNDTQTHWSYSYVQYSYENDIVKGVSATEFNPDGEITWAQLLTLLARICGYDDNKKYADLPYANVKETDWYYNAASYIYSRGFLEQYGDTLDLNASVNRADTIYVASQCKPYSSTLWTPFNCKDRDQIPTYALNAVDAMYTCGIVNGTDPTTFSPNKVLTRAEVVTILYRLATALYGS